MIRPAGNSFRIERVDRENAWKQNTSANHFQSSPAMGRRQAVFRNVGRSSSRCAPYGPLDEMLGQGH